MPVVERTFRAMGTDCQVLVCGPVVVSSELADLAQERVEILEQCWSRFRPDSELSRLNACAGMGPRPVSADMLLLVQSMQRAWTDSDGLFDPTVLASMRALGYDEDFARVSARAESPADVSLAAAPGMSAVRVDVPAGTVELPLGIGLDPGAIGKGLAADVIAEELAATGALGVLVNLGGDISVIGELEDEAWVIGIEDERCARDDAERVLAALEFPAGAARAGIATSTTLKRRWAQGRRHHVIDPRTGSMCTSDLVQVTVLADSAARAEVAATTAILLRSDQAAGWLAGRVDAAYLLTPEHETVMAPPSEEETTHG